MGAAKMQDQGQSQRGAQSKYDPCPVFDVLHSLFSLRFHSFDRLQSGKEGWEVT